MYFLSGFTWCETAWDVFIYSQHTRKENQNTAETDSWDKTCAGNFLKLGWRSDKLIKSAGNAHYRLSQPSSCKAPPSSLHWFYCCPELLAGTRENSSWPLCWVQSRLGSWCSCCPCEVSLDVTSSDGMQSAKETMSTVWTWPTHCPGKSTAELKWKKQHTVPAHQMNAALNCKLQILRIALSLAADVDFCHIANISSDWSVFQMLPLRSILDWAFTITLPLAAFSTAEHANVFAPAWNLLILNCTSSLLVASFNSYFQEMKTWNVKKKAIAFSSFSCLCHCEKVGWSVKRIMS